MNITILEQAVEKGLIPKEMVENVKSRKCPLCGDDTRNPKFNDPGSVKEFNISGMCQKCQDKMFPH